MTLLAARAHLRIVSEPPKRDDIGIALSEIDMLTPDGRSRRRFQFVRVRRGGRIIDFKADLGPSEKFTSPPVIIVGSTDPLSPDTVGELWDMAEEEREGGRLLAFLEEKAQQSTLIADAIRQTEQMAEFKRRNSRTVTALKGGKS
jgi:hypothetical protein